MRRGGSLVAEVREVATELGLTDVGRYLQVMSRPALALAHIVDDPSRRLVYREHLAAVHVKADASQDARRSVDRDAGLSGAALLGPAAEKGSHRRFVLNAAYRPDVEHERGNAAHPGGGGLARLLGEP